MGRPWHTRESPVVAYELNGVMARGSHMGRSWVTRVDHP